LPSTSNVFDVLSEIIAPRMEHVENFSGRDASFFVAIFQLMSRCSWYSRSMVQNSLSKGSLEKTRGRDKCRVCSLLAFIPESFLGIVLVYLRCYGRSLASFPVMREIRWDDSISRKSPSVGERFALPSAPCNFAGELVPVDASAVEYGALNKIRVSSPSSRYLLND